MYLRFPVIMCLSFSRTLSGTGRTVTAGDQAVVGPQCQWLSRVASQVPAPWPVGASAHQGTVLAVFPRSLQGGEMYQEGPGHNPATVPTVCPGPGLCPLAVGSNKLGPRSWPLSLALAPSKEVSFPTGQLGHSPELDFMMYPGDAAMAVSIATLAEPSPTGGFTPGRR